MNNAELVEVMAESAHDCWWRAYKELGYTSRMSEWGEEFMVPFEELSELGKDFDRTIMWAILNAFTQQGYTVTKLSQSVMKRLAVQRGDYAGS